MSQTLRAFAETRLSKKKTWAAPDVNWVPLRRAVFGCQLPGGGALLREWTEILKTKSGAQKTAINPTWSTFSFHYLEEWLSGEPWQLLEGRADTFFCTLGMDNESFARSDRRRLAVREATEWVYRQLMLPAFNHAVSIGAAVLYGRPKTLSAYFEQLPANVWPRLKVVNWQEGVAVAPNGSAYMSIHVQPSHAATVITNAPATSEVPAEIASTRTYGPKPHKRKMVEEAISRHILDKTLTPTELREMREKNLAETYGASRDTVRKARNVVLSRLSANSNSDK